MESNQRVISKQELEQIAKARLKDAEILAQSERYDGAFYLCGYAVELGLKYRICKTLRWNGYPLVPSAFKGYQSFKTHQLDVLLHLTGIEDTIVSNFLDEWSNIVLWNPEMRYEPIDTASKDEVEVMILSTKELLGELCKK